MNISKLKSVAYGYVKQNYQFWQVFIVLLIPMLISGIGSSHSYDQDTSNYVLGIILPLVSLLPFTYGALIAIKDDIYDVYNLNRYDFFASFRKYNAQNILLSIGLSIVISIYTILWTILLIVPGIIKGFAYSQAPLLLADDIKNGAELKTINEYITLSRAIMDGKKASYFWMNISMIGWFLLGAITFGVAFIFVIPYYYALLSVFYQEAKIDYFNSIR